ncbi:hypothetical protein ACQKCF_11270 [Psychrobacter proteolyticus]|uniref:hypothetical protein n=1 Tax=Psychrobacter proteolyticus TaxID=147825 RepID=UPI003D077496
MSILIGIGIVTTVTTFYLGRKGWLAFHKVVGISPGLLTYQDYDAPLSLATLSLQQLTLNKQHLKNLSEQKLRQLKRIDEKVSGYHAAIHDQHKTPAITEAQFVLNKMLQIRLPEMLATHYQLTDINVTNVNSEKRLEASELLQSVLDNIEQRLDRLLAQMDEEQLQELRVMKHYINSHDS